MNLRYRSSKFNASLWGCCSIDQFYPTHLKSIGIVTFCQPWSVGETIRKISPTADYIPLHHPFHPATGEACNVYTQLLGCGLTGDFNLIHLTLGNLQRIVALQLSAHLHTAHIVTLQKHQKGFLMWHMTVMHLTSSVPQNDLSLQLEITCHPTL